jgi:hypothetical protein
MTVSMNLIRTLRVDPAANASPVTFNNIPQGYDDLVIKFSPRENTVTGITYVANYMRFNADSSSLYSWTTLYGNGSSLTSTRSSSQTLGFVGSAPTSVPVASLFASTEIYIPNYKSSLFKTYYASSAAENNNTFGELTNVAGVWRSNAPITSLSILPQITFTAHSTFSLYGVIRGGQKQKATGGNIYFDSQYCYHVFNSNGTFVPSESLSADVLVIAGGGGGGVGESGGGGGGGAGGVLSLQGQQLSFNTSYSVTIGNGGAPGANGQNSVFGSLGTAIGGGSGGTINSAGINGGSGGGVGRDAVIGVLGGLGTVGQGFRGGNGKTTVAAWAGAGGGGGAGGPGGDGGVVGGGFDGSSSGVGGPGTSMFSSWSAATQTGVSGHYAGGGGGVVIVGTNVFQGLGGIGGGGNPGLDAIATNGTANTGSGGGGARNAASGSGGSGIVIVRYPA